MDNVTKRIKAQTPEVLDTLMNRRSGVDRRAPQRDWVGIALFAATMLMVGFLLGYIIPR